MDNPHLSPPMEHAPPLAGGPSLVIADGTLAAMKWLALVLMTLDHANKYLFAYQVEALFAAGRIAMPLFAFVLAYNLARPEMLASGGLRRTGLRLAVSGALASVPIGMLGQVYAGWWPLNIMFTLLVATIVIALVMCGGRPQATLAIAVFVVGGALVEYAWFAVGLVVVCWRYCTRPGAGRLAVLAMTMVALFPVNHNLWALLALPVIVAAPHIQLSVPRFPLLFYLYYPAHLAVLLVLSRYRW